MPGTLGLRGLRVRQSIDIDPPAGTIEAHASVDQGEDGVVAAEADILARDKLGAALPNNDIARDDGFAAKFLNAEPFADAVAPVFDAALSFFMGHKIIPLCWLPQPSWNRRR